MTMELLAPAGGEEPFRAALAAGADAIYCGVGNDFNARRGANNFTYDAFERACRAAHLAGTRVYVTINVVVRDEEMDGRSRSCARRRFVAPMRSSSRTGACSRPSGARGPSSSCTSRPRRTSTTPAACAGRASAGRTA